MNLVFIGFGEAAFNIALGLKSEGINKISAFDINKNNSQFSELIHRRAKEADVVLFDDISSACQHGNFIFSLTNAKVAEATAKSVFPHLKSGQVYVDMNSAAPTVKEAINQLSREDGVLFCDASIMGTVPGNKHKVPMYLAGEGAKIFADAFQHYNMKLTVLNAPAGGASAIKMFKSIVMKGIPQLFFESFEGAYRYGVLDKLTDSLAGSLENKTITQLANTFTARTLIHAARRKNEMQDVLATLDAMGVDASMVKSTIHKLEGMARQNWHELLGEDGDKLNYLNAIEQYCELKK